MGQRGPPLHTGLELGHGSQRPSSHSTSPPAPLAGTRWPLACLALYRSILLSTCVWLPRTDTCLNPHQHSVTCSFSLIVSTPANKTAHQGRLVTAGWRRAGVLAPSPQSPQPWGALWYRQGSQHLRGLARNIPCIVHSFVSQIVTGSFGRGGGVTLCARVWNITACKTECPCLL